MLTALEHPLYTPGDVWRYQTRPGNEDSCLTILRVESSRHGVIVHIRISGLGIQHPAREGSIVDEIGHVPITEAALHQSVTECVGFDDLDDSFEEGYRHWRAGYEQGQAGAFSLTVAEVVGYCIEMLKAPPVRASS